MLDQSDCQYLFDKLHHSQYGKLKCYNLQPFSKEICGYLGDHQLLTLTSDGGHKYLLFVKIVEAGKGMLKCFEDMPFFEKEVAVYKFITDTGKSVPILDTTIVPKLLLQKTTSEGAKLLVFENLATRDYRMSKSLKLDCEEVYAGLRTLAKFHTVSIALQQTKKLSVSQYFITYAPEVLDPFFVKDSERSGNMYSKASESGAIELAKLIFPGDESLPTKITISYKEFLNILNEERDCFCQVLCHGDLWTNNLLFRRYGNNIDAKIIDFQLCRCAPPAHDVTMFIYMATDTCLRKQHLKEFYNFYYDVLECEVAKLNVNIAKILSREEFDVTCKMYMLVAKLTWLCYRQTSEQSPENYFHMQTNSDYMMEAVIGNGRPALIRRLFEIDPAYKEGMISKFKDIKQIYDYELFSIEEIYMIIKHKLIEIYQQLPEYKIIDYSAEEITKVSGYLGSYYRINLHIKIYCGDKKSVFHSFRFFAKMIPKTDALRHFHAETNCGYKEKQFYSEIVPKMREKGLFEIDECVPRCYFATLEGLVFDDLINAQCYQQGTVRATMPLEDVKVGLESLAKLHACGLILEECMGNYLDKMYPEEFKETFYTGKDVSLNLLKAGKLGISKAFELFDESNGKFIARQPDLEKLKSYACKYIDSYVHMIKPSATFRNTICHGDIWASNIMFKKTKCKIIDFQSYRYCPCTHDLTQFLYFAMFRDERRANWQEMIAYYYDQFSNVFKKHDYNVNNFMTFDEFTQSVENEEQFAMIQNLTHFQTILLSSEALEKFFSNPEMAAKYVFEDRSEHVRYHWENDKIYKQRLEDAIKDFIDFCVLRNL